MNTIYEYYFWNRVWAEGGGKGPEDRCGWVKIKHDSDDVYHSTFIAIVLRDLLCRFPLPLFIFYYLMMSQFICKYENFWQEDSVGSDT